MCQLGKRKKSNNFTLQYYKNTKTYTTWHTGNTVAAAAALAAADVHTPLQEVELGYNLLACAFAHAFYFSSKN